MNKITTFLVIVITALGFVVVTTMQSKAQSKTQNKSFVGVIPFMTSSDRMGFLDENTGRIYMYDNNLSQCLFVGQITQLGQPIQAITK